MYLQLAFGLLCLLAGRPQDRQDTHTLGDLQCFSLGRSERPEDNVLNRTDMHMQHQKKASQSTATQCTALTSNGSSQTFQSSQPFEVHEVNSCSARSQEAVPAREHLTTFPHLLQWKGRKSRCLQNGSLHVNPLSDNTAIFSSFSPPCSFLYFRVK